MSIDKEDLGIITQGTVSDVKWLISHGTLMVNSISVNAKNLVG